MILVGGCMRSGTTVVQSVITSSVDTNPLMRECDFMIELVAMYKRNIATFQQSGLHQYFGSEMAFTEYMRSSMRQFMAVIHARFPNAKQLVLKNPELTVLFPMVYDLLPDTLFVITVRDPRDTVSSMLKVNKKYRSSGQSPPIDFKENAGIAAEYLTAIYQPIFDKASADATFASRVAVVKYEDLCSNPKEIAEALSRFSGLDLSGYESESEWNALSSFSENSPWNSSDYGKKVTSSNIGNFVSSLSLREINQVESVCAGLMDSFGYVPFRI